MLASLPCRHCPNLGMRGQTPVQGPEEGPAPALEMLPRVLAVQDDGDDRFSPAALGAVTPSGLGKPLDKVRGCCLGIPPGIVEADQVRQRVVAEQAAKLGA